MAEVIGLVFGDSREGLAMQAQWLWALSLLPTRHSRRQVLAHVLMSLEWSHRHAGHWRVTGAEAYIGRQHEEHDTERFDPESGEVRMIQAGQYTPNHGPDTIATRSKRSATQCHRYRSAARKLGLIKTSRTPGDAPDGTKPWRQRDNGTWAYAHHWIVDPPPALKARWAAWEKRRSKKRRRRPNKPDRRRYTTQNPPRVSELAALGAWCERDND